MSNEFIDRLAREMSRKDSLRAWMPRAPSMSIHMGTLAAVDNSTNTAHFAFNDPSGLVLPGVRVLQAYSMSYLPAVGHTVWMQRHGTDVMIVGQHVVTTNTVTP